MVGCRVSRKTRPQACGTDLDPNLLEGTLRPPDNAGLRPRRLGRLAYAQESP